MIFRFGKGKKLSDVLKVATFLEKEGIEYEMLSDITIAVGPNVDQPGETTEIQGVPPITNVNVPDNRVRQTPQENDPLWRPGKPGSGHDICDISCKDIVHYGAEAME